MKRLWPAAVGVVAVAGYAVIWLWVRSLAHGIQRYLHSLPPSEGVGPLWLVAALPYLMMAIVTIGAVLPVGVALLLLASTIGQWLHPGAADRPSTRALSTTDLRLTDLFAGQDPLADPRAAPDAEITHRTGR
ncbi:MAG TPA: hypothetical protein VI248_15215 [Kineosporiaceae bacterium]